MNKSRMKFGALLAVMLIVSIASVSAMTSTNMEPQINDLATNISKECTIDLNDEIDNGSNNIEQSNVINVYDLFGTKPSRLPVQPTYYKNANNELKYEMESIVSNVGMHPQNGKIIGMFDYNEHVIVLVDSNDTVTEIITDKRRNTVATYQLEPEFIDRKILISKKDNFSMETIVDLHKLGIKVPKKNADSVEILYTDVITAQNEAWKELIGCPICLLYTKDMNVVSKGKFYIDYGNTVETILDISYSETNCKTCISKCSFDSSSTGAGTGVGMVDATAIWAANSAPVTADFEINSWVSIDKNGNMDSGASEDSWVTPGFGCFAPPTP